MGYTQIYGTQYKLKTEIVDPTGSKIRWDSDSFLVIYSFFYTAVVIKLNADGGLSPLLLSFNVYVIYTFTFISKRLICDTLHRLCVCSIDSCIYNCCMYNCCMYINTYLYYE